MLMQTGGLLFFVVPGWEVCPGSDRPGELQLGWLSIASHGGSRPGVISGSCHHPSLLGEELVVFGVP